MTIVDEILARKRVELERAKLACAPDDMSERAAAVDDAPRGFRAALSRGESPRIVAEIKRRSPSAGEIRPDFDPVGCAKAYADAGAAALSVLTDEHFFGGHLDYLTLARQAVPVPLLRKDFVIDAYQIDEARVAGADAVLLIASAFAEPSRRGELGRLRGHALERGLDALVEVHDERQLDAALEAGADLVGINNRDLRTFSVDLGVTERLAARLPQGVVLVAESGILRSEDVVRLQAAGAHAFLVGEALMREPDIGAALRRLRRST